MAISGNRFQIQLTAVDCDSRNRCAAMAGSNHRRLNLGCTVDFAAVDFNDNGSGFITSVAIADCRAATVQIARPSVLIWHIQIQLTAVDRNLFRAIACAADQSACAIGRTVDLAAVNGNRTGNFARICANTGAVCRSTQLEVQRAASFNSKLAILRYVD